MIALNSPALFVSLRRGVYQTAALLLVSCLSVPLAQAADEMGVYFETLNRGNGMTEDAPQEELSKTYLAHGKMKVSSADAEGTDMILDPASGNMTFLNHAVKQYYQINVGRVKESMSQPGMEQMRAMMAETKITVTPTDEMKKIGEWNCKKYLVKKTGMMSIEQEIWATEEVDVDVTRFTDMMSLSGPDGLLADTPEGKVQQVEMAKVKGYPILTKTKMQMMGSEMETESEVKVIRKEAIAASQFEIPADYSEKEMEAAMDAEGDAPAAPQEMPTEAAPAPDGEIKDLRMIAPEPAPAAGAGAAQ